MIQIVVVFEEEHEEEEEQKEESVEEEEETEMQEKVEEEEQIDIDRNAYYEKYKQLLQEHNTAKRKNTFLMRKMAEYYKKRRMDHVLRESDRYEEYLKKYHEKLDAFAELKELEERERTTITEELQKMTQQRNEEKEELERKFEDMQARERHIGIGLILSKTGKPISDKVRLVTNI